MSTTIEVTDEAAADVLTRAAAHIEKVGHQKGGLYDGATADRGMPLTSCRVNAWGALYVALTGLPRHGLSSAESVALADRVEAALIAHLGLGDDKGALTDWSDDPLRTTEHVVTAFRETAADLGGGA